MKKQAILGVVLLFALTAVVFKTSAPIDEREETKRGAVEKEELSSIVFNAIRLNDFGMLLNYIPNELELEYLKTHAGKKNQYIYDGLSANQLEEKTRENFEKTVREGIESKINWSVAVMTDSRVEQGNTSDKKIYKGILLVQGGGNKNINISFDLIKIKNKWFLFQGMRMEK